MLPIVTWDGPPMCIYSYIYTRRNPQLAATINPAGPPYFYLFVYN